MNNKEQGINEVYGDGMGKSGNGQEQSGAMERARNYPGRFAPTPPDPKDAERQAEIDRVRG